MLSIETKKMYLCIPYFQNMNYQQTVDWIFEKLPMYQRIGAAAYKADLNNTKMLMEMTDSPHAKIKCIHIAGTNGKGSVSHMLASILQEAGLKTGLYTSPHLVDYRERMKINGKMIPQQYVSAFIKKHKKRIEKIQPSFFEISFAMSMSWFVDEKVDIAVIETGMGGRLDSTNVITPVLSVITNIGIDHAEFLGDTKEKIALEKAGIIKHGVPVVIGESNKKTNSVFRNAARRNESILTIAGARLFFYDNSAEIEQRCGTILRKGKPYISNVKLPLNGVYQKKNVITVICAVRKLKKSGIAIKRQHIRRGLLNIVKNTGLFGRWQIVNQKPLVICDVAHNQDGLTEVFSQLQTMTYKTLHLIVGTNIEKDLPTFFSLLPEKAVKYYTAANVPRALPADVLADAAAKAGLPGKAYPKVSAAYKAALAAADETQDLILVTGSTFVVAEIPGLIQ